jgi:hypothetical protein
VGFLDYTTLLRKFQTFPAFAPKKTNIAAEQGISSFHPTFKFSPAEKMRTTFCAGYLTKTQDIV